MMPLSEKTFGKRYRCAQTINVNVVIKKLGPLRENAPRPLALSPNSFPQTELAEDAVQDGLSYFFPGDLAQFMDSGGEFQGH